VGVARRMRQNKGVGARLVEAMLEGAGALPRLFSSPRLLGLWLLRSHAAQAAALVFFLLLPWLSDQVIAFFYSDGGGVKGLWNDILAGGPGSRLAARQEAAHVVLYWIAGAATVLAFLASVPRALARGQERLAEREAEADRLADHTPSESVLLYREALAYASDTDDKIRILRKIRELDERVSASARAAAVPPAEVERTILLEPEAAQSPLPASRYQLLSELGRGAMGVVWRARDTVLDREVAVKELPPGLAAQPSLLERLRREARVLAKMSHPGIVQVYDFVEEGGRAWIVMEFVEGEDLEKLLYREVRLECADALPLGLAVAEALAYAHKKGILHRDLKPANVLLPADGGIKVTDFGVSKFAAHSSLATQAGALLGSPAYMSPEQASGKSVDERSDLYAFGALLFRMLVGRTPFEGDLMAVIAQVLHNDPPRVRDFIPDVPEAVEAVVMRCLARNPDERYADLSEAAAALAAALG